MIKINKFVADYFFKTEKIVTKNNPSNIVVLQFFQRKELAVLAGINEALEFLKKNTDTSKYKIKFLPEGSLISSREVVLELEGPLHEFGIYEGIIDGILARSTSIATNAYKCVEAAKGKEIIYMADRSDHYLLQQIDGKAARLGGVKVFSSIAQNGEYEMSNFGSMPHALIQNFSGNIVEACKAYHRMFPEDELIALVDFNNDVITDSLKVLAEFGNKLYGVRVDTSQNVVDKSFGNPKPEDFGVSLNLIKNLRLALNEHNGKHVKIIVSSGFDAEKIAYFEANQAPVDSYGVGEFMTKINYNFSADATMLNGTKIAKFGRYYQENKRLIQWRDVESIK